MAGARPPVTAGKASGRRFSLSEVKVLRISASTNRIQRNIIARIMLGATKRKA